MPLFVKELILFSLLGNYATVSGKVCLHFSSGNCCCHCFPVISYDLVCWFIVIFFMVPSNSKKKLFANNRKLWVQLTWLSEQHLVHWVYWTRSIHNVSILLSHIKDNTYMTSSKISSWFQLFYSVKRCSPNCLCTGTVSYKDLMGWFY